MSLDPTKQYFTKYTNERLGSAFTESNSGKTVTEAIESKADASAVSSATEVNTALANKATKASAFTSAEYNSTDKKIYFKNESGTQVGNIDVKDFIKDGMIDTVELSSKSGTTYLVITWNTDAGKDVTELNIGDLFEADNYYTKSDLTGSSTTVVVAKASSATTAASAGAVALSNVSGADDLKAIEALTGTSGILKKTKANTWSLDTTSYSSATDVNTALGNKVDKVTGKGLSTNDFTDTEKTNLDSLATNIAAISGITSTKVSNWDTAYTNNHTHSNKTALDSITGNVGTAAYKAEGYFAGSGHTHSTTIATSTGTNQITLSFGSKYSLNAGGTSYIFTMPSSASSWNSVTSVTTSSTNGNISVNGSDVAVKGLGGAAYLNTGTTAGTVAAGNHTHDYSGTYQAKGSYLTGTTKYAGASTQGGAATSAGKLTNTTAVGSVTQPVFFTANGVPSACTYTLGKSVPSDAVFTDTNYYATALTVSTAATTNSLTIGGNNTAVKGTGVLSGATTSAAGLMTKDDKVILNNLSNLTGKTSTLSAITASSTAINSLTGTVGTMAFKNASSYSSATEVSTALNGKVSTATTVSAGTGLSGGGNLGSDVTLNLAMPTVHTATTYTSSTITSSEPIVYCVVTASGDLNNQTCPVTLAEGQQCIVIYKTAAARTISFGKTGIITPDGSAISITTKANGYCEVNYIKLNGDIFLRGV